MQIRKAVIPAAGLGTRFLPATKAQPKEMLPIVDKPTIQYIIEEAVQSGIEDVIIVTGRNKRAIEDHFDRSIELELFLEKNNKYDLLELIRDIGSMVDIHYVRQKEALGLGHAIYSARRFIGNEPFAVLLGDDVIDATEPCLKQMLKVYEKYQGTIIGVQPVPDDDICKYGIIDGFEVSERVYKVNDLVEKPEKDKAPSNIAILGRYIISPRIFEFLENAKPGKNGEIQLTDALKKLAEVENVYAYNFIGDRYDVGNKMGYLKAMVELALKRDDLKDEFLAYLKDIIRDR